MREGSQVSNVSKSMVSDLEEFITEIGGQICQEKLVSSVAAVRIRCYESPEKGFKLSVRVWCSVCTCVSICVLVCG